MPMYPRDDTAIYQAAGKIARNLTKELTEAKTRIRELEAQLAAMTADRDLWQQAHEEDCPNKAENEHLKAQVERLSAPVTVTECEKLWGQPRTELDAERILDYLQDVNALIAARKDRP